MSKIKLKISDWKFQTLLLYIFFTVGIIGHFWAFTFPLMVLLTPYVILFSGIWAIHKSYNKIYLITWIVVAYAITFFLEVLGVAQGLVFGPYYYGNVLGPQLFNVPVIIGLNWVFIIFSLVLFSEWLIEIIFKASINTKIKIILTACLTASFATLFDYIMEPAAVGLNYWIWTLTSDPMNVPLQNYLAWFIISFIFAITLLIIPEKKRITLKQSPHSPWFVLIQVIFFIAIRILVFFN